MVTGRILSARTLAWAVFFSVVLLPPLAFGIAMLLGTTVNARLTIPLAVALGILGLAVPGKFLGARPDAGDGNL